MTKVLKTKQDWIDYAMELEAALLLRPACDITPDEQWIAKYREWYWSVPDLWLEFDTSGANK